MHYLFCFSASFSSSCSIVVKLFIPSGDVKIEVLTAILSLRIPGRPCVCAQGFPLAALIFPVLYRTSIAFHIARSVKMEQQQGV